MHSAERFLENRVVASLQSVLDEVPVADAGSELVPEAIVETPFQNTGETFVLGSSVSREGQRGEKSGRRSQEILGFYLVGIFNTDRRGHGFQREQQQRLSRLFQQGQQLVSLHLVF